MPEAHESEYDMSSVAKMIETIETEMDAEARKTVGQANPEHLRMVEALLFAASEPLDQKALSTSLPEGADVPGAARRHFKRFMRSAA